MTEAEVKPTPIELFDIKPLPTTEAVNTLRWFRDHPGQKGIAYKNIHGENKYFTYGVDRANGRYIEVDSKELPGHIRLVYDRKLNRTVVAKASTKAVGSGWGQWSEITQEAHFTASDQHPNIATVYDIAADTHGELYMIMEYLPNKTVQQWMKKDHEIPEIASVIGKVSQAIDHVNNVRKLIYADMKPLNVGFDEFWNPKLIDFELAETMDESGIACSTQRGTPTYAAPEQLLYNGRLSVKTDVYSLAATFFSILADPMPDFEIKYVRDQFEKDDKAMVPFRKAYEDRLSLAQRERLSKILHQALQKDPSLRQATVLAFNNELQEALVS